MEGRGVEGGGESSLVIEPLPKRQFRDTNKYMACIKKSDSRQRSSTGANWSSNADEKILSYFPLPPPPPPLSFPFLEKKRMAFNTPKSVALTDREGHGVWVKRDPENEWKNDRKDESTNSNANFEKYLPFSTMSVTSSSKFGRIMSYILYLLPNRGIWRIKHEGTCVNKELQSVKLKQAVEVSPVRPFEPASRGESRLRLRH